MIAPEFIDGHEVFFYSRVAAAGHRWELCFQLYVNILEPKERTEKGGSSKTHPSPLKEKKGKTKQYKIRNKLKQTPPPPQKKKKKKNFFTSVYCFVSTF